MTLYPTGTIWLCITEDQARAITLKHGIGLPIGRVAFQLSPDGTWTKGHNSKDGSDAHAAASIQMKFDPATVKSFDEWAVTTGPFPAEALFDLLRDCRLPDYAYEGTIYRSERRASH